MVAWFEQEEKRRGEERRKILETRRKDIMARFEAEGYKAHQCVALLVTSRISSAK